MADFMKDNGPGVLMFGFLLSGIVLMVVAAITVYWMNVRREETRAHLVRDLIDRGVPLDQVERLAGTGDQKGPVNEKKLEGDLASILVQNEVPGATVERVLRIYQRTDPATKKAVYDALEEIAGSGPTEEQLIAAVTALCPARLESAPTAQYQQAPASA
jgi:hypothetical protein